MEGNAQKHEKERKAGAVTSTEDEFAGGSALAAASPSTGRTEIPSAASRRPYVLDFYCEEAALCIEVDGAAHDYSREMDERRDAWLAEAGIRTLRLAARDVLNNLEGALQLIVLECRARPLHHSAEPNGPPPLQGGFE